MFRCYFPISSVFRPATDEVTVVVTMAAASAGRDVFMGNLRDDVRVGALKQSIIHLLHQVRTTWGRWYDNLLGAVGSMNDLRSFVTGVAN